MHFKTIWFGKNTKKLWGCTFTMEKWFDHSSCLLPYTQFIWRWFSLVIWQLWLQLLCLMYANTINTCIIKHCEAMYTQYCPVCWTKKLMSTIVHTYITYQLTKTYSSSNIRHIQYLTANLWWTYMAVLQHNVQSYKYHKLRNFRAWKYSCVKYSCNKFSRVPHKNILTQKFCQNWNYCACFTD